MRNSSQRAPWLAGIFAAAMGSSAQSDVNIDFFEQRIRPVLAEHCYECHSAKAKKLKAELRLDTREGVFLGGETGPVIVPGKPEESLLVTAVQYHDKDLQMPPPQDHKPRKLPDPKIADLIEWVRSGAPMPQDAARGTAASADAARSHWAFQPPQNPAPPAVADTAWPRTDIDRFILARLEAEGLHPSPPADPRTLTRRMSFDLTGLPPTNDDVERFTADSIRDPESAVRDLIDRLLASPQYGERWGRHWLDLARYSDTKGYVYAREERFFVHAYAYRDWVIRAFNDDLPYDRFLLLQIAADQLVPPGSRDLAAMGFITGGRRFIGVTHDIIDDRIDVVTRGTMALTVQCARCHDHKFDPIPTQDYYALYGVFHNCAEQLVRLEPAPAPSEAFTAYEKEHDARAAKLADIMRKRGDEAAARLRARVADYLAAQLELQKYPEEGFDQLLTAEDIIPASVRRWRDFLFQTKDAVHSILAPWQALAQIPAGEFAVNAQPVLERLCGGAEAKLNPLVAAAFAAPPKNMHEAAQRYGDLFARIDQQWKAAIGEAKKAGAPEPAGLAEPGAEALRRFLYDPESPTTVPDVGIIDNELFFPTSVCEELWKFQGEVDRWIIKTPASPAHALILVDREPEPNPRVLKRGNPARRGEEVPKQFPRIVAGPNPQPFQHGSGRLELAQAIVHPDNPLTARVMVNRIWMHHFGAGIVQTGSDFGTRADPPSHRELLDWLARRFIAGGWSVKQMHRLIMASAVYRQASEPIPDQSNAGRLQLVDPENRLLSRFNRQRLDFEQVRDGLLAVTGELDSTMAGKSNDMFSAANKRRSIYGLVDRQFLPGSFRIFDFANPDLHIAQRHATTVPQQALFFLNDVFAAARSKALAARPEIAGASDEERVQRLYQLVLQRPPTPSEATAAKRFIAAAEMDLPPPKPVETAWRYGWGEYDHAAKQIKAFAPLPHFTGKAWQGGSKWPDDALGWAQLTAEGGHAGNDLQHAVIRRWIAPRDATVAIAGSITHEVVPGDGVRAFVVSNRQGELKSREVHNSVAEMAVPAVEVKQGDTLDFVVDFRDGLNSDQFKWAPVITVLDVAAANATAPAAIASWNAKVEFSGPAPAYNPPLKPWEQYAQVLLLSNEFVFVD